MPQQVLNDLQDIGNWKVSGAKSTEVLRMVRRGSTVV